MLYRIDKNTMLDLPKWKCRAEFRDYYLAKLHHRKDVDLLAKLKARCDEVEERHKRWSEASRIKATRMWQRPGERDRVDWSQAIAVDVFNLDGTFVATFPSARKAAIGMFGEEGRISNERNVRQCRMGLKKSLHGFMFRNHEEGVTSIEPYQRKPSGRKKGEHYNRQPGTFATQRVGEVLDGEVIREWKSVKECAAALGMWTSSIIDILNKNRTMCRTGTTLVRLGERRLQY